jgi:hypothetical protein
MVDTNTEVLQAAAHSTYNLDLQGAARKATGLNLDLPGICRTLWGKEVNEARVDLLTLVGGHGLLLPGDTSSYVSTPDDASLDITGDIDVRVEFVRYTANVGTLISKFAASNRSYLLRASAFGLPLNAFGWSTNGTNFVEEATGTALSPGAYRATLDVDNGASGYDYTLEVAETMDGPWTVVDSDTVAGATSVFSGAADLRLGLRGDATNPFEGRITRAQVRSGIDGTIVANPDFRGLSPGTTSFEDSTGKTWTLAGNAAVV